MTDSSARPDAETVGLLTPASRAVAGLALAVAGLLGQNAFAIAAQMLLMGGPEAGDPGVFGVGLGVASAVPAALALLLTRSAAQGPGTAWHAHVSRAAVVLALLVLAAAVLTVVGGLLQF
jgi:hypothetical protein